MGRLIDANKLKAKFPEPADWKDSKQALVHITGICAKIDAAETVEAITLEWIREYLAWLESMDADVALGDARAIKVMLAKWEMEQGHSGCGPDYCELGEKR